MKKLQIFLFCFISLAHFHGSFGDGGFDFNPHEVIRKSRSVPVSLDLSQRAAADPTGLTYVLPTSIQGNGPQDLLNTADELAKQADNLLKVLQDLEAHFSTSDGEEIQVVKNMTIEVNGFQKEYNSLVSTILTLNQTIESNNNGLAYIEKQLICMRDSACHGAPTSPPPPAAFNCSDEIITKNVTQDGDSGFWSFPNPTTFNCSLTITSKKDLWLNIDVTNFNGAGEIDIFGEPSGTPIGIVKKDSNQTSFPNIADTGASIKMTGVVSFNLTFNAVYPCKNFNCNNGDCYIDPANKPACKCDQCYSPTTGNNPCSNYTDPCAGRPTASCGYVSGGKCIPQITADACTFYCYCPNKPVGCEPQWCDDDDQCETGKKMGDSKMFWKRHEDDLEHFEHLEDFDPYEFVQQAQADATSLNFTIPEEISERDPYELLEDATELTNTANSLLAQLQYYLKIFNSTSSGDQRNDIQKWTTRLNIAQNVSVPLQARLSDLQTTYDTFETTLLKMNEKLTCLAESECHPTPVTTTRAPPPDYVCNRTSDGLLSAAGDSKNFNYPLVYNFPNCAFKIKSAHLYGLWINIKVSNFVGYDDYSLIIEDPRGNQSLTVNGPESFFNLTSAEIIVHVNGELQFKLDYSAVDPCAGKDCVHGTCIAGQPKNLPNCACTKCYTIDGNDQCTVHVPPVCPGKKQFCTADGGTCIENLLDCSYYCKCPNVPNCTTLTYCDKNDDNCPDEKSSFFSSFLKYFKNV